MYMAAGDCWRALSWRTDQCVLVNELRLANVLQTHNAYIHDDHAALQETGGGHLAGAAAVLTQLVNSGSYVSHTRSAFFHYRWTWPQESAGGHLAGASATCLS